MTKVIIGSRPNYVFDSNDSEISLTVFDEEATDDFINAELARFQSGELTVPGYGNMIVLDRTSIPDNDHYFFSAWTIDSNNNITVDFSRAKEVAKVKIKQALKAKIVNWMGDQSFGDVATTYVDDVVQAYDTLKTNIDSSADLDDLKTKIIQFFTLYLTEEFYPGTQGLY